MITLRELALGEGKIIPDSGQLPSVNNKINYKSI